MALGCSTLSGMGFMVVDGQSLVQSKISLTTELFHTYSPMERKVEHRINLDRRRTISFLQQYI